MQCSSHFSFLYIVSFVIVHFWNAVVLFFQTLSLLELLFYFQMVAVFIFVYRELVLRRWYEDHREGT